MHSEKKGNSHSEKTEGENGLLKKCTVKKTGKPTCQKPREWVIKKIHVRSRITHMFFQLNIGDKEILDWMAVHIYLPTNKT